MANKSSDLPNIIPQLGVMHSQLGPKLKFHSWANNANLTSSPVIHGVVNQQFNAHTEFHRGRKTEIFDNCDNDNFDDIADGTPKR